MAHTCLSASVMPTITNMVQQQIRAAAKHLSLIASLLIALGPMASAGRCCCFGKQVRQWIGSISQDGRCCADSLAHGQALDESLAPQQAERSCCRTSATKLPATIIRQDASACESSAVDARACRCEQGCQAGEVPAVRAQSELKDLSRTGAEFAVAIGFIAPPPVSVLSRNDSPRVTPFLSAQDRCVLLCRWLN